MDQEFIVAVALSLVVFFGAGLLDEKSCHAKAESFSDVKYSISTGCMVKSGDRWLPLDNVAAATD